MPKQQIASGMSALGTEENKQLVLVLDVRKWFST
jgi:hypothetical protein